MTGWNCLAIYDDETSTLDCPAGPGRLKPESGITPRLQDSEPRTQDSEPRVQNPQPPESHQLDLQPDLRSGPLPDLCSGPLPDLCSGSPPDLHLRAAQERQDAIEALLRQLRPAIVRYCRARLARTHLAQTGSQDEDDLAQEVCLALLTALPSYQDMGRPFGAFVFAIAAHKVADAARSPPPARRRPLAAARAGDTRPARPVPGTGGDRGGRRRRPPGESAAGPAARRPAAPAPAAGGGGTLRRGHRLRARHGAWRRPGGPAPGADPAPCARRPRARRAQAGTPAPRPAPSAPRPAQAAPRPAPGKQGKPGKPGKPGTRRAGRPGPQ